MEKLTQYNGTYIGDSNTYAPAKIEMIIEDGNITLSFVGQTKDNFEMLGYINENGQEEMVFALPLRNLYIGNNLQSYDSDKYALFIMNGTDITVSSRLGNSYKTWNAYFVKQ